MFTIQFCCVGELVGGFVWYRSRTQPENRPNQTIVLIKQSTFSPGHLSPLVGFPSCRILFIERPNTANKAFEANWGRHTNTQTHTHTHRHRHTHPHTQHTHPQSSATSPKTQWLHVNHDLSMVLHSSSVVRTSGRTPHLLTSLPLLHSSRSTT